MLPANRHLFKSSNHDMKGSTTYIISINEMLLLPLSSMDKVHMQLLIRKGSDAAYSYFSIFP